MAPDKLLYYQAFLAPRKTLGLLFKELFRCSKKAGHRLDLPDRGAVGIKVYRAPT